MGDRWRPERWLLASLLLVIASGCRSAPEEAEPSGGDGSVDRTGTVAEAPAQPESDRAGRADPRLVAAELDECLGTDRPDRSATVIVWLVPEASDDEVAAMDALLIADPDVEAFEYVDREQTYLDFEKHFEDQPEVVDLVEPEQLPTSFVVTLVPGAATGPFEERVEVQPGVDDADRQPPLDACRGELAALAVACLAWQDPEPNRMVVWLNVGASDADIEAANAILEGHEAVASSSYHDRDRTWADFRETWADEPEVLELVDEDQLPTSFRVELSSSADPGSADGLIAELEDTSGVDEVEGPFPVAGCDSPYLADVEG